MLLVDAFERRSLESDLGFEFGALAAAPPVQMLELALGACESLDGPLALPLELFLLLREKAEGRVGSFLALVKRKRLYR